MDQRESARYPVAKERQGCELHFKNEQLSGKLLDESFGGFAILVRWPKATPIQVQQELEVKTHFGWFRTKIVHIRELRPTSAAVKDWQAANAAIRHSPQEVTWYQFGVRRLGNVAESTDELAREAASATAHSSDLQPTSRCIRVALGVGLGTLLLMIIAVAVWCRH
jgi:hypothetical protein